MKRAVVYVLILILFGTAGFGAPFFATITTLENHALLGTFGGFILPESCYPNLSLYLETYIIDQASLAEIGLGSGTNTENSIFAGGLGMLNVFPVGFVFYEFHNESLDLFGKASLGPLAYPCCCLCCFIWNTEVIASLKTDFILANIWLKDVFLPDLAYSRIDANIGCFKCCEPLPILFGIDVEKINSTQRIYTYLGTLLEFPNITLVPKLYLNPCCNAGIGFNLSAQF